MVLLHENLQDLYYLYFTTILNPGEEVFELYIIRV